MKLYTKAHNRNSLPALKANILIALGIGEIPAELHWKYERKSGDYMRAYLQSSVKDPFDAAAVMRGQKQFRSHRGIPPSEYQDIKRKPWEKYKETLAALLQQRLNDNQ